VISVVEFRAVRFLQCFDSVSWATGSPSGLQILALVIPKGSLLSDFTQYSRVIREEKAS